MLEPLKGPQSAGLPQCPCCVKPPALSGLSLQAFNVLHAAASSVPWALLQWHPGLECIQQH